VEKVKQHFRDNRANYISGGVIAASAFTAGVAFSPQAITVVDAFKFNVLNFSWKSPTTNITTTIIERRGHPGFKIRVNETGQEFASMRHLCKIMNISRFDLYKHLRGETPDVRGFTFTNLGEMS
jgi:hypothetical protein